MSKTLRRVYDQKLTFEKIYEAYLRTYKGKTRKREVLKYMMDLETNLILLLDSLKNESYRLGKYYSFYVHEPKQRLIKALPFRDRIVHQWYVEEFIKPFIVKRFIFDTYACLTGKGTHKAVYRLQHYMRLMKRKQEQYFILKCDISKFFYNIDRKILFQIIQKYIQDKKVLRLTYHFIYDDEEEKGIPIGNYTSQYFANIYLNELDHYVKEILHVKYYLRYMDDFVLLVETKQTAQIYYHLIENFLLEKLNLRFNNKSGYFPSYLGVDFCGYRIFETHMLVRKRCKIKIKRNLKLWRKQFLNGTVDVKRIQLQFNSFKGHVSHASSYGLVQKVKKEYESMLHEFSDCD